MRLFGGEGVAKISTMAQTCEHFGNPGLGYHYLKTKISQQRVLYISIIMKNNLFNNIS